MNLRLNRSVFCRLPLALSLLVLLTVGAVADEFSQASDSLAQLLGDRTQALEAEGLRVGVIVEDLSGRTLYSHRADDSFVLASNAKLFTTAAALAALPDNFRWETTARVQKKSLWIVGGGDAFFAIENGYSYPDAFLDGVASALKAEKKTSFAELVVDARYFDAVYQHPLWPKDQLTEYYCAPVCGLPYARGLVKIKPKKGKGTIEVATSAPDKSVSKFLADGLKRRGIKFETMRFAERKETTPSENAIVFRQPSPKSLAEVIVQTNRNSDNYLAEHLMKTLGREVEHDGSYQGGARAIHKTLANLGVALNGYHQEDGSGLARAAGGGNLATPRAMSSLLRVMANQPQANVFVNSLAIAGREGTLRRRYLDSELVGRVVAKTGFIKNAVTLSGYLLLDDGRVLTFSILVNDQQHDTAERRSMTRQYQESVLTMTLDAIQPLRSQLVALPISIDALSGVQ